MTGLKLEDLGGIELFIAAIRLGSVSAAAREHGVSQPSGTARLRGLERRLGVTLLERGPTGSVPTPAGEAIAQWANEVIIAADKLADGVSAIRSAGGRRHVRMMASLTIAEYVMPKWLHAHRRSGGPAVDLTVGNSLTVEQAVSRGDVMLGFVETPRRIVGLRSATVGGDSLKVVVSPTHPWARRRTGISAALLASTPLLVRERGSGTRDAFEDALAKLDLAPCEPLAVMGSTTTLKSSCLGGEAPSVLSELAVIDELASGALVSIVVESLDLGREFRAIWRPSTREPDVRRFVRLAQNIQRR